jgi:hypothetical protein
VALPNEAEQQRALLRFEEATAAQEVKAAEAATST